VKNGTHSFLGHDPQDSGPQYLEDLSTAYWFSYALFTAVETGLFSLLEAGGRGAREIASALGFDGPAAARFLDALCSLGLVSCDKGLYFNTRLASDYLTAGKEKYQGRAIMWRKELIRHWSGLDGCLKAGRRIVADADEGPSEQSARISRYMEAMDAVALSKAGEIIPFFEGLSFEGELLDVGAGSGSISCAFLEANPGLRAHLLDIPEVIGKTREMVEAKGYGDRVEFHPVNILEPWPFEKGAFNLVLLSNIVHAYSEEELPHILSQAASALSERGVLVIHDFFLDHFPEKAALFDINMLINTYNGRVFPAQAVIKGIEGLGLASTGLIPLASDTGLIVASREQELLDALKVDERSRLMGRVKALGFRNVVPLSPLDVSVPEWTQMRCEFGCDRHGSPGCPPYVPDGSKTTKVLEGYSLALLLEGEPPTRAFQRLVLSAEKEAFVSGFYKAFAFWAGPCSLCPTCVTDGRCRNRKEMRPSMEGAGIDVFETVRGAGLHLSTLSDAGQYVKYFALLLVE
jgi:predicted metal-binding protein